MPLMDARPDDLGISAARRHADQLMLPRTPCIGANISFPRLVSLVQGPRLGRPGSETSRDRAL